jgi:hypothetical protein
LKLNKLFHPEGYKFLVFLARFRHFVLPPKFSVDMAGRCLTELATLASSLVSASLAGASYSKRKQRFLITKSPAYQAQT